MSYKLSTAGRQQLDNFISRVYQTVGVPEGRDFAVEPSVVQNIVSKALEADAGWFLKQISAFNWVNELKGEKVGLSVSGLVSSRTDTSGSGERTAKQVHGLDADGYELSQVNRDLALRYSTIDSWRHQPDFQRIWAKAVRAAIINDVIRVGWHGTSAAATTNPTTNPNGEDVAIGWLQQLRNKSPAQIDEAGTTIGSGGDYANLDALVHDAKGLIDPQFRKDPGLRVMTASDILQFTKGRYYASSGDTPSEKNHLDKGRILETYGGLQAMEPPYIPDQTLVICNPRNLAHYIQEGSNRRSIIDNPKKDQVEDFNSANEGYVIEEPRAIAVIGNVSEYVAP